MTIEDISTTKEVIKILEEAKDKLKDISELKIIRKDLELEIEYLEMICTKTDNEDI